MVRNESLPQPAAELERLAAYYDENDTSAEMVDAVLVDPAPMVMTSLRLSSRTVDALKELARVRGVRYTALLRDLLESAVVESGRGPEDELAEIKGRLARVEAAMSSPVDVVHPRVRVKVDGSFVKRARRGTVRVVRHGAG